MNVNQVDCLKNRTALHWAVASDNDEMVTILKNASNRKINFKNFLINK